MGYPGALSERSRNGISWESLEEVLIAGDVGVTMTERVIDTLRAKVSVSGPDVDQAKLSVVLRDAPGRERVSRSVFIGTDGGPARRGQQGGKTTTAATLLEPLGRGRKTILAAADAFVPGASNDRIWEKRPVRGGVSPSRATEQWSLTPSSGNGGQGCDCLIVDTVTSQPGQPDGRDGRGLRASSIRIALGG